MTPSKASKRPLTLEDLAADFEPSAVDSVIHDTRRYRNTWYLVEHLRHRPTPLNEFIADVLRGKVKATYKPLPKPNAKGLLRRSQQFPPPSAAHIRVQRRIVRAKLDAGDADYLARARRQCPDAFDGGTLIKPTRATDEVVAWLNCMSYSTLNLLLYPRTSRSKK